MTSSELRVIADEVIESRLNKHIIKINNELLKAAKAGKDSYVFKFSFFFRLFSWQETISSEYYRLHRAFEASGVECHLMTFGPYNYEYIGIEFNW